MIKLKIDVTKIVKDKLFVSEKTGAKYLDAVLIETPNSEYSDYMVCQEQTKEEREKDGSIIIGNASKIVPKATA